MSEPTESLSISTPWYQVETRNQISPVKKMDRTFVLQTKNRFGSLIIDTGNCDNHIEDADIESIKPLSVKKQPQNKRYLSNF